MTAALFRPHLKAAHCLCIDIRGTQPSATAQEPPAKNDHTAICPLETTVQDGKRTYHTAYRHDLSHEAVVGSHAGIEED